MITIKENTNAVDYTLEAETRILLHVVNCQGVMGSGIAKEIRTRIPFAYQMYMKAYQNGHLKLGSMSTGNGIYNLAAQDRYGTDKRHLNYGALGDCLNAVRNEMRYVTMFSDSEIVIPYKMGCDRAGGDWNVVYEMIEYYFKDYEVVICSLCSME